MMQLHLEIIAARAGEDIGLVAAHRCRAANLEELVRRQRSLISVLPAHIDRAREALNEIYIGIERAVIEEEIVDGRQDAVMGMSVRDILRDGDRMAFPGMGQA